MQCPICKTEMRITSVRTEVVGDESKDRQTEVYTVQELVCRNKQCQNYGKAVDTVRTKIYPVGGDPKSD